MLPTMKGLSRRAVVCALLTVPGATGSQRGVTGAEPDTREPWSAVLNRLDDTRSDAFTRGRPSLLRRVYVPGSRPLRVDTRVLHAYVRRGLEVDSVQLQVTAVEPLRHTPTEAVLRVVDRLAPVRVRVPGGTWTALPRDRSTERVIRLRRVGGAWRIAAIRRISG